MKWNFKSIIGMLSVTFIIVALFYTSSSSYQKYEMAVFQNNRQAAQPPVGKLQVTVVDGYTEEPLEGARVVIPEIKKTFTTNDQGMTPLIQVPILEDEHFRSIMQKPWGEITLLVYKDDYIEYALFHTHVWENQVRNGPRILLFPKDAGGKNEPFSLIEGPHRLWVNELVKKFRPK